MVAAREPDDAAIQRWLKLSLRQQHAEVLREPIPQRLLDLLADQDRD